MADIATRLIWIDLEMTGLYPDKNRILEVALVVTDPDLNTVAESPSWAVHQDDAQLNAMDAWNQSMHGRSGLIDRVKISALSEADVERAALDFLIPLAEKNTSPMCGNSICQDRRFLARWMPELEAFFHYRNLDVSTLKELCKRWRPDVARGFIKDTRHEALADIHESIEELKYYRTHFIRASEVPL